MASLSLATHSTMQQRVLEMILQVSKSVSTVHYCMSVNKIRRTENL